LATSSSQVGRHPQERRAVATADTLIRLRLRRMAPEAAATLRELFYNRDTVALDGNPPTTWRFGLASFVAAPAAVLHGSQTEWLLSISDDGLCERVGECEWWDYDGEPRLLAWTLAHRVLIEGLGQLLREPAILSALIDDAVPPADPLNTIPLVFSVTSDEGRKTAGALRLPVTLASRLASHSGWRRQAPASESWSRLPARVRIELRGIHFPLAELKDAETGDVLVLGRRPRLWQALTVAALDPRSNTLLQSWSATSNADEVIIGSDASKATTAMGAQEQTTHEPERVPVVLDLELAVLAVTLGEIAAFAPGHVLKLPTRLEDARAVIRANGTRVGYGELVAVGDTVGVLLQALEIER
jgi:type III secretion system YscQ/HrcQ family protein